MIEGLVIMNISLNDQLNLRDYIVYCVDFIKANCSIDAQPRTIISFFFQILKGLRDVSSSKDTVIKTLQKLFSGNVSFDNTIIAALGEDILSSQYDDVLTDNLRPMCDAIRSTNKTSAFYSQIMNMVSLRFFDEGERRTLREKIEGGEHESAHLLLLKHGFATLYNIPCFFAERMYEEALTYEYDSPLRYALMKTAAENGNKNAAIEYGNYIVKKGAYTEAFAYLMMALPLQSAMWNLAFLIEKARVGEEEEKQFRAGIRIEEKLAAEELTPYQKELDSIIYTGNNPSQAASILFCYKVYFYLAHHGLYKGYNSMAKLLSNSTVSLSIDAPGSKECSFALRDRYWRAAISGCNLTAISNEGNRLFREELVLEPAYEPQNPKVIYMRELMEVAASMQLMHASYNLGNYYEFDAAHSTTPIKNRAQIKEIYQKAAALDLDGTGMNGNLYYRLGVLAEKREEKQSFYERALLNGKPDAAYQLALICFDQFQKKGKTHYLLKAENYLREYQPHFSLNIAPLAKKLSIEITTALE